jgi:hypothetical protein
MYVVFYSFAFVGAKHFIANLFLPWGMWFSFGKGNDFISKSQQCLYVSLYAFAYAPF